MTTYSVTPLQRLVAALIGGVLLFTSTMALAATRRSPILVELPEITTSLDRDRQVTVQVTLRVADPGIEASVRERMVRLRHALVMQLADAPAVAVDGSDVESLLADFRDEANLVLDTPNGIRAVLVQKFVVKDR